MKKIPLSILLPAGYIVALFIRLMLIPNPGFEADISFWKSWGLAVVDFGIVKGLPLTNFNYPTPFGYFLAAMVKAYSLFADPHNFNQFWQNTNLPFLFVSKLPAVLADFGIAGILLYIGKHAKKLGFPPMPSPLYPILALVYLLNPISIMDGAWWGQLDALGVFLFLLALLFLLRRMSFIAGVLYMVAMMTKLQNMIYGPIFFLFAFQLTGLPGLIRTIAGALTGFVGLNIEFILARNSARIIESLTSNYDYFPWLSLNAFNPWWIFSGAAGMKGSDKILVLGLVSAKNLGLYLFSGAYLFAVMRQWFSHADKVKLFLESFVIVNGAFFLFQTESHDRYAFPLIVILLLLVPFYKKIVSILIPYALFTILYSYNFHYAFIVNYPQNGLPIPASSFFSLLISYLFTGGYCAYLVYLSRGVVFTLLVPVIVVSFVLGTRNLPLILDKPVSLTRLTPISYKQDYGGRTINMPTNASLGFNNWSYLSVQYSFYRSGIGTHANSFETYDIGGLFRTFSFDYGIDTEAGPKGSVTFEVYGDDKKLFESKKIGRYDYPRHADVNVTGVRMLKLVVTDAGDGNTDDHADWLNPKLYE